MVAYFSSKLTKQMQKTFTAVLLVFCLLGTHWIGLSHSISHGGIQSQTLDVKFTNPVDKGISHSSEACHLFDALSLAGFIPNNAADSLTFFAKSIVVGVLNESYAPKLEIASYQSRAPPTFIL